MSQRFLPPGGGPAVCVGEGLSWPAFLLGPLWTWTKRLRLRTALLLALLAPLALLELYARQSRLELLWWCALAAQFVVQAWCGTQGNRWQRARLLARGYRPAPPAE